jgi:ribosomal protein S18 acetylase RimI-like enzyme
MKAPLFRVEPLVTTGNDAHDRATFRCGEEALDRYFQTQATQDIRRRVANCFVAVELTSGQVAGFYTMSAAGIPFVDLPPEETKRLPRYPTLPAVRIGRLAVDERFQGRGLGAALLTDAAHRAIQADAAAFTLLVDAKNDRAVAFMSVTDFGGFSASPGRCFSPWRLLRKPSLIKPVAEAKAVFK